MADWDESAPGDSDFISQFPTNERAARAAAKTNFGVDHEEDPLETHIGRHHQVTLIEQASDPAAVANTGRLYSKDAAGETELFYRDAGGTIVPLTAASMRVLSGLTPAADRGIYFTGATTGALFTLTSFARTLLDDANAAAARTTLGLGSLATLSSISDSNWSGTDLAVANGGTGSSTAADARSALGLAIGSDVQAHDSDLDAIAALAKTNGNFIVGNGSAWVAESGSTARSSLGLGSLATLSSINDSNWSGTDLAVANGGTGASSAAGGLNNLLPSQTGNSGKVLQTDGTNASWQAVSDFNSDGSVEMTAFITFDGSTGGLKHDNGENFVSSTENGSAVLYYNGAARVTTTSAGVSVAGAGTFTGDVTWLASDERLKQDFIEIPNALETVRRWHTDLFHWDEDACKDAGFQTCDDAQHVGFRASELHAAHPSLAPLAPFDTDEAGNSKSGKHYRTVKYERAAVYLAAAIKELAERLEALERRMP